MNMDKYYENVLSRYQPKITLQERGFLHSYGDDCEVQKKKKKKKKKKLN